MKRRIGNNGLVRLPVLASAFFGLTICGCAIFSLGPVPLLAETPPKAPSTIPAPDDRYKADILVIVAHPDDDTGISNYLAKAVLDEGKRAAVIFSTKGNSGGNTVGMEQGKTLSDVREMEGRRALAVLGITNVWFLRGTDTPTQDVLHSLETLGHGEALEEVVRLVRLTRPEVIITWLPAYVAGENHGDHQASGVVATEAYDMAGDPTAFPEQVSAPRAHADISNYGEGLHTWQAKKLYYISDASHPEFLQHHGPTYLATGVSRARGVPISTLNKSMWDAYATQGDDDIDRYVKMPEYLVLAKSLAKSPLEADVLDGIGLAPAAYDPTPGYRVSVRPPLSMELGGPWAFYEQFYRAHALTSVAGLVKPQAALGGDHSLWVPLLLHNDSAVSHDVALHATLPEGWTAGAQDVIYHLAPRSTYPVQLVLNTPTPLPAVKNVPPVELHWVLSDGGKEAGVVNLTVYLEYNGVPQ